MKRCDDRRAMPGRQQRAKAERLHAGHQRFIVGKVAAVPGRHAAFFVQLLQGLGEGTDDVGGRGIAPFAAVLFHLTPLIEQIQLTASGPNLWFFPAAAARPSRRRNPARPGCTCWPTKSGNGPPISSIDSGMPPKDDMASTMKTFAMPRASRPTAADRVQQAGGGFTVDHGQVRDGGIALEGRFYPAQIGRFGLRPGDLDPGDPQPISHLHHAFAVGPVVDDQYLAVWGNQRADGRLNAEGAAPLDEHAGVAGPGSGQARRAGGEYR